MKSLKKCFFSKRKVISSLLQVAALHIMFHELSLAENDTLNQAKEYAAAAYNNPEASNADLNSAIVALKQRPGPGDIGRKSAHATAAAILGGEEETNNQLLKKHAEQTRVVKNSESAMRTVIQLQTKKIQKMTSNSPERSVILNDQDVINRIRERRKQKKIVTEDLANQAQDPEIRKNLLIVAKSEKEREDIKREENRLTSQLAEFGKLAAAAAAIAENLGEIKHPGATSTPISQPRIVNKDNAGVSAPTPNAQTNPGVSDAELLAAEHEKAALLKELDDGKSKTGSKAKDLSLKNKLVAELRAAEAAEQKRPGGASESGVNEKGKRENAAAKVASDVLVPSGEASADYNRAGGSGSRFSLGTSETSAEVKRMTDDAERQLAASTQAADDIKAGILETDSVSLFERVKSKITGCLRQRCVSSSSQK